MERSSPRAWDWLSAGLLFSILQVAAGRLVVANWAPWLYFASILAALGATLGLALGTSRFRGGTAALLALDYTVLVLPWEWSAAQEGGVPLSYSEKLHSLALRLGLASTQFLQRAPVRDSLFFVAFVCLAMWIISVAAGEPR